MRHVIAVTKALALFLSTLVMATSAYLVHLVCLPGGKAFRRKVISYETRMWCKVLCFVLRFRVRVEGKIPERAGYCVISNHQGYLDIPVIGSILRICFVSKADVRHWPFVGWVASSGGTIYVNRSSAMKCARSIDEIGRVLRIGGNCLFFPEGTSTEGARIRPFKSTLFQAPTAFGAPLLPVVLRYETIDGKPFSKENRDHVTWYGRMDFLGHFWGVLRLRRVEARLRIGELLPVEAAGTEEGGAARKAVAARAEQAILRLAEPYGLRVDPADPPDAPGYRKN